jgi:outer membrane immunogenic protein
LDTLRYGDASCWQLYEYELKIGLAVVNSRPVTPNVMAYATGGAAWARIDYAANNFNGGTYLTNAAASSTQSGFVVGGGLEWAMTKNWLVRGEYLYYRFSGAPSLVGTSPLFAGFPSGYSWSSATVSVARAGLSYKF